MAVNQTRTDTGLLGINDGSCVGLVAVFCFAESNDQSVNDDDGVGVKNGLVNIARQPDVALV